MSARLRLRLADELELHGRALPLDAGALEVRSDEGPQGFHRLLRELLRGARRRISIASLYLGTGRLEAELVDDLRDALRRSPELEVRLVMDHCRGRRRTDNGTSASFLAPLLREHGDRVEVYLHRMPQLEGLRALLPSPLDECIAVCHFKAMAVDDLAVLTGANLSDEYFHCRQARQVVVRDPAFVRLSHALVARTAGHSLRVRARGQAQAVALDAAAAPATAVGAAVLGELAACTGAVNGHAAAAETLVAPLFQHPALAVQQERELLRRLFAIPDGELVIATPYTNFPDDYVAALASRLRAGGRTLLIVPSGNSHSFTTGRGAKALVPSIYLERERRILAALTAGGGGDALTLLHYDRAGWVFHAKGIWLRRGDETATVIGSSSFGARSVSRDFDLSCLIVTRDRGLGPAFTRELLTILAHTREPRPVLRPGRLASRWLAPLVKGYM